MSGLLLQPKEKPWHIFCNNMATQQELTNPTETFKNEYFALQCRPLTHIYVYIYIYICVCVCVKNFHKKTWQPASKHWPY
jgi:hypothetical protein